MSSPDPIKLLPRACGLCGEKDDLRRRCSGCRVVYYCEHKHRVLDHMFHWSACEKTKEARRIMEKERIALWDMVHNGSVPNDLFKDGIGYFGAVPLTEPYILAKYQLANTLLLLFGGPGGRVDAVQAALDCFLRMFQLNRGDRQDVRSSSSVFDLSDYINLAILGAKAFLAAVGRLMVPQRVKRFVRRDELGQLESLIDTEPDAVDFAGAMRNNEV
ncbi:hypothetical protein CDV36_011629 [Fusarium kuroshium]|uniref:MYND-type domain-containing protein n=1 Tax=Fusarium kuroshium TaxID=2010991 RepID=A0A3M2RUC6_9HYPO|nr:hypothetical protein CDV36_011629 [Fusarium kuroshium]